MSMTVHFTGDLHERIKRLKAERNVGQEAFVRAAITIVLNDPRLRDQAIENAMQDGNRGVGRIEGDSE